jgi:hypothetical protein
MLLPLFFLLPLAALGVIIWGVVDAAGRPDWAWQRTGDNKTLWIVLQALGFFFCLVGVIFAIIYLLSIRPKLQRAEQGLPGW